MTSPVSSYSRKSELPEPSDPDMGELTSSMGRNTLSDEASSPGTTQIDPRIKSDGCQGYTVGGNLCVRYGKDVVQFEEGIGYYCFQHNPEKEDQRCLAYNKKGGARCANTCSSDAGEVREDGRPICNTHHKWGAKLVDGSYYPAHRHLNKKK